MFVLLILIEVFILIVFILRWLVNFILLIASTGIVSIVILAACFDYLEEFQEVVWDL
jgi:hypothetical protein